ncbi:MAG TPA: hypothetical protein VG675_12805 [Bryobacteraceae bacterium]|nr:hypothetical protein [Bryobacteraceae bacterium]
MIFQYCLLSLALAAVPIGAVAAQAAPVKLGLSIDRDTVSAGEQLVVEVHLLNTADAPVAAPRPLHIVMQARQASGKVEALRTVDFWAGESAKKFALAIPGSGLVYLWAKNAELLPGGAFVRVRGEPAQAAPPPPMEQAQPPAASHSQGKSGSASTPLAEQPKPPPMPAARPTLPATPLSPPRSTAPVLLPANPLAIALRFSPDRAFLADGSDAVTVQAFVVGDVDAAPQDIRLNIFDSSGTMHPAPLMIPKGEASGKAVLTSAQPGTVTVEYLGSAPSAQIEGDKKLAIQFRPPITKLSLRASPPGISLLDTSDLLVTLTDSQGRPLATDAPRTVSLAMDSGHGTIEQQQLQIPAGGFEARSRFQPGMPGHVSISASTPNLFTATLPVVVSLPVTLLILSALGGTAGGFLAYMKRKRSGKRQIGIGLVTGFVFYWACIFLGLASVSRGVALNPLGAFVLSIAGGWLQTNVLQMITTKPKARGSGGSAFRVGT